MIDFEEFINTDEFQSFMNKFTYAVAINEFLLPQKSVMRLSFNFWLCREDDVEGRVSIRDLKIEEYEP